MTSESVLCRRVSSDLSKIFRANRDINPTRSNLIRHITFAPRTWPADRLQRLASVTAFLATSEVPCTHVLQSRMHMNHFIFQVSVQLHVYIYLQFTAGLTSSESVQLVAQRRRNGPAAYLCFELEPFTLHKKMAHQEPGGYFSVPS